MIMELPSMREVSSFNSLQTGKPIQRHNLMSRSSAGLSFNSLQTGKPIQRKARKTQPQSSLQCFNSLQTGKPIQSENSDAQNGERIKFQFPSNGKADTKACGVP